MILTLIEIIFFVITILIKIKKRGIFGDLYLYAIIGFIICLLYSILVDLNYIKGNPSVVSYVGNEKVLITLIYSIFDALKMMVVSFDRDIISTFFKEGGLYSVFSIVYIIQAASTLAFTSIVALIGFFKVNLVKIKTTFRAMRKNAHIHYLFSDAKVDITTKIAKDLLKDRNNVVILYVSRGSLKTSDGAEYKDKLVVSGFDVRCENFSSKLCAYLFNKYFKRIYKNSPLRKKVTVYGLFSSDNLSMTLAKNFTSAIRENKYIKEIDEIIKNKDFESEKANHILNIINDFKVFISYQEADFDLYNKMSSKTYHIVNTISQYDMVSSTFILDYPINKFIDINKLNNATNKMHISFMGLGKINKPIFEKMTNAYQLYSDYENEIHYHIYDKDADALFESEDNIFINKTKNSLDKDYYQKPNFYYLDVALSGKDLTSYEVLDKHFRELLKENDPNRFSDDGFEIFVVSLKNTNTDAKLALDLRTILLKHFGEEKLRHTAIFVRIDDELIENGLFEDGCLLKDANKLDSIFDSNIIVPIIAFGQNALMPKYIKEHFSHINEVGRLVDASYASEKVSENEKAFTWLTKDKRQVLINSVTSYSLSAKLAILGLKFNEEYKIIDNEGKLFYKDDYLSLKERFLKEADNYPNIKDTQIKRISELEHNRWLASAYSLERFSQIRRNDWKNKGEYDVVKEKFKTRLYNDTRHICLTTNKGLVDLFNDNKAKANKDKENKEGMLKANIKLCYLNDINSLTYLLGKIVEK